IGSVSTIYCTVDGAVYAGGRLGISRFDSNRWSRVLPTSGSPIGEIRKIVGGRNGSFWAAASSGLLHYDGSNWVFHTRPETADPVRKGRFPTNMTVKVMPESVFAKPRGSGVSAKRYDFLEVCEDLKGRVWLGTASGEILCYEPPGLEDGTPAATNGLWTVYNEADGVICGNTPSILALQNGAVWVAYVANSGCISVFDSGTWRTLRVAKTNALADFSNLVQTRDGVVWLSGRYVIWAYRDGQWRSYEKPEVPIPSARNYLMQTADGALWIAGPGTEIQRVDYQTSRWRGFRDLNFQWESPSGAQWFLRCDGSVVVNEAKQWTSYDVEDGTIAVPVALVGSRDGSVWVAGSHDGGAAMSRFDGREWKRFVFPEFSASVEWRGVYAASDGSVWFSAAVESSGPKTFRNGILQYRNGTWIHHHQPGRFFSGGNDNDSASLLPATQKPEPIGKFLSIGESPDGGIWAGRNILAFNNGRKWSLFTPPPEIRSIIVETFFTTRERDLWVGSRQFGALRFDGHDWQRFQGKDSLVANSVRSFAQTSDGSIWAATDRDICRFDGHTWTADVLPARFNVPHEAGSLKASASGRLWINRFPGEWVRRARSKIRTNEVAGEFWTVGYQFKNTPPETVINTGLKKVSQPGNISILWSGSVPWRESRDASLQYSFRMDDQPWSPFMVARAHSFFTLAAGKHH
ncbi:MAG TPA: two-component regulator propeller domain-containing protein, partial [Candidatus Paceibacterota bacterium]|nr:two-component regulator propeller domain-containing protein [Candidatus Paceibacterota bacterium]